MSGFYLMVPLLGWLIVKSLYRLYFHPISHIPGPKLAAMSYIYQFYFDVIRPGQYVWEIKRLHDVYGPIIRINPREIHINDPEYYEEIYASSSRERETDPEFVHAFGLTGSILSTVGSDPHRRRREPLNRFFSRKAISALEPLIQEKLNRLLSGIEQHFHANQVINIDAAFVAYTADVIHHYTYGYSENHLERDSFNNEARDGLNGLFKLFHLQYFFPIIRCLESLPLSALKFLNIHAWALAKQKRKLHEEATRATRAVGKSVSGGSETVIDALIASRYLLPEDKAPERLKNEGMVLITAGTETTGRALAVATFHLYSNPHILDRLRKELCEAMPRPNSYASWYQLEQLPYLSAVINESFRLASGTSGRFSRIAPAEMLVYQDIFIPPGTPVSMTNHLILRNSSIFPNPGEFDPERWLRAATKGERLERYLVNFSKGSRSCLGRNLAIAEMFLVLANLVRRFDIELFETPQANIECGCDFIVPYPRQGCLSVRALVTRILQD